MKKFTSGIYTGFFTIALCLALIGCGGSEKKFANHIEKGKEYYAASKYKEASIEFKNAVQIKPDDADAHYNLGLSYLKHGGQSYLASAYKSFQNAVKLNPGLLDAQTKLGELYLVFKDLKKATEQADLVLGKEKDNLDGNLLRANIQLVSGKPKDAQATLLRMAEVHRDSIRPLMAMSSVYMASRNNEAAKDVLNKALSTKPDAVEPHLALSAIYMSERNAAQAEKELIAALSKNPKNMTVLSTLTNFYIMTGKREKAEETAAKLVEAAPESPESYINLARIQKASGNKEKARETVRKGIDHSSNPAMLQKLLAGDYLDDKDLQKASEYIEAALKSSENDPEALFLRGRLRLIERKAAEALPDLKAYAEANPKSPIALYFFGLANKLTGNASAAKTAFSDALTLAPKYDDASFMLAISYLESREVKLAAAEAQKLQARNPSYPGLILLLGDISLSQGRHAEAARYLETHLKANPQDASGFAKMAAAQKAMGNSKKALENAEKAYSISPDLKTLSLAVSIDVSSREFERAVSRINGQIAKTPDNPALHFLLGSVFGAARDDAKAEQAFRKAIEKDGKFFMAFVELGNLYARKGSIDDALKQYRESVNVNPKLLPSYMLIGMLSEKKGDHNGAIDAYKKALEIDPKFAPAANNLAWLYSERGGNIDMALTLAETAKGILPDEPGISDTLGWIYYKKQAYMKAIALLEESAAKLPNEPNVRYHLGMAYYKKGEKALARRELKRALEIKGDFEGSEEALKTLAALK